MTCVKCGARLPDSADFCPRCGAAHRSSGIGQSSAEPRWETCEVTYDLVKSPAFGKATFHLVGVAIGPSGRYRAATSIPFKDNQYMEGCPTTGFVPSGGQESLDDLIRKLTRDGWDHVGNHGPYWWQLRFRRRVK